MSDPRPDSPDTLVRRFYDAATRNDAALVDEALAPDWEAIPPLRHGEGADGWRQSIATINAAFDDLSIDIEDILIDGDRVAVRSTARGVHTGELMGIAPTGRSFEYRAMDIHRIADGRIVQTWHLEDYLSLLTQLGATVRSAEA